MQYTAILAIKSHKCPRNTSFSILHTLTLTMYHTVYPSQMTVQIMNGQQTGGQCPPTQAHALHINGVNTLHQTDFIQYGPDISGHNRHRMMQVLLKYIS